MSCKLLQITSAKIKAFYPTLLWSQFPCGFRPTNDEVRVWETSWFDLAKVREQWWSQGREVNNCLPWPNHPPKPPLSVTVSQYPALGVCQTKRLYVHYVHPHGYTEIKFYLNFMNSMLKTIISSSTYISTCRTAWFSLVWPFSATSFSFRPNLHRRVFVNLKHDSSDLSLCLWPLGPVHFV